MNRITATIWNSPLHVPPETPSEWSPSYFNLFLENNRSLTITTKHTQHPKRDNRITFTELKTSAQRFFKHLPFNFHRITKFFTFKRAQKNGTLLNKWNWFSDLNTVKWKSGGRPLEWAENDWRKKRIEIQIRKFRSNETVLILQWNRSILWMKGN